MKRLEKTDVRGPAGIAAAVVIAILLLVLSVVAADTGKATTGEGNPGAQNGIGTDYADTLFDHTILHTIDLRISDLNWSYMIRHATEEEYVLCDAVIDGNRIENIAIRPKGNSSLTAIQKQESEHYSFKIEFDHYRAGNTYLGLDKMSLNNLGCDPTCMKDYFAYRLQQETGAAGPLAAYTLVQVNGKDFGLYLAVEGVEDSFALRNYGEKRGQIYKPEAYGVGTVFSLSTVTSASTDTEGFSLNSITGAKPGERVELLAEILDSLFAGSRDKLAVAAVQYRGDDPKEYRLMFDSASFPLTEEDKRSYIQAVKTLNSPDHPEEALDLANVIPYFAAHNFVDNYDGYTGSAIHNFYLRECDGKLSMIALDYNLAFGAFTADGAMESMFGGTPYGTHMDYGEGLSAEENAVNYPIDTPVQLYENKDRPMFGAWIDNPSAHEEYYRIYERLCSDYFESGKFTAEYQAVYEMLHPLVEQGLSFYTTSQFGQAANHLSRFCLLRAESIKGQIQGLIPATKDGQLKHPERLLSTGDLNLGKTISFDGLVMGITGEDIIAILDGICQNRERSLETVSARTFEVLSHPSLLPAMVVDVWKNSAYLRREVLQAVLPGILTLLCLILMLVAVFRVRRGRGSRRRAVEEEKTFFHRRRTDQSDHGAGEGKQFHSCTKRSRTGVSP